MAKLAAPGSKQPLQPSLTFHPDSPPAASTAANAYSYADWVAIIEDFNLESSHRVRALEKASGERFQAIERHWTDTFASLDERVKGLSLARFVGEFGSNLDVALAQLVREQVGMRPMGIVEQSARKRKRFMGYSPTGKNNATDDENDLFASTTSKKQRSTISVLASAQKGKKPAAPGSVNRAASVVKKTGSKGLSLGGTLGSPTSSRKPARLRLRPSTSQNAPPPSASASSNFIYRNPLVASASGVVPPTPQNHRTATGGGGGRASTVSTNTSSFKTISRKPRRGESIVIRSLNDSPLGEFVAEESDDDDEDASEDALEGDAEEHDDEHEWDLMDKNEASKIEDPQQAKKRKNKLKGKGKPPPLPQLPLSPSLSQSQTTRVPSSSSFGINLPANAPSYEELKKRWKEEMLEKLRGLEESGDLQRKGLEGVLGLLG
ncbi:hypothetical protein JCM11491_000467 [Sporobolomyces phaffii]